MKPVIQAVATLLSLAQVLAAGSVGAEQSLARIETHDNITTAGSLAGGELRLRLRAGLGSWSAGGPTSAAVEVAAFGEEDAPLRIPSPLIRVPRGTVVRATIRNTLASSLTIRGLCDRPGACAPITVSAGHSRDVTFRLGSAGTFHYWATTTGASTPEGRQSPESQLGGALIVDPIGSAATDGVFVIGIWNDARNAGRRWSVINGRSWPETQRLSYAVGQAVRWRLVNLSDAPHAMHLHGFYFRVDSVGNGVEDTIYSDREQRMAVTEYIAPARAVTMTWVPERAGNWLFHCHMLTHMMDVHGPVGHSAPALPVQDTRDPSAGMSGLVLGINVTGATREATVPESARRRIQMRIDPDTRLGTTPSYQVSLEGTREPPLRLNESGVPGPVMVLTRGEPVAVDIVNRLSEPAAIHWHGIELESYDDGVPGFGGHGAAVTPSIPAGGTFTARFTPPRAGTFIYHTHWHNAGQLTAGVYGPLIVLDPGQTFDATTDHIVVLGLDGPYTDGTDEAFAVNGRNPPRPIEMKRGVSHRLRFINITADNVALTVQLAAGFDPIRWTLAAKDGADTPRSQRTERPARQLVSVGETYDFEVVPPAASGPLWMELRRGSGELLMQWPVLVR